MLSWKVVASRLYGADGGPVGTVGRFVGLAYPGLLNEVEAIAVLED